MLAWLAGMGIVSWRYVKEDHSPPCPGDLAIASGAFAISGLVAMANEQLGNLLAWGLDAAALLALLDGKNPLPGGLSGLNNQTKAATGRLSGSSSGSSSTTSSTGGS